MSALVGLVPGLVATAAALLFVRGYSMMRSDPADDLALDEIELLRGASRETARGQSLLTRGAYRLAGWLRTRLPDRALVWLQRQVDVAGRPQGMDVNGVLAGVARWLLLLSPVALLFLLQGKLVFILLCAVAAAVLPLAKLAATARKRREQIDRDLPDFIDVLAVTVTAGVGFRAALATVAERFGGPLGEEVQTSLHQIDNGASVRSAFVALRQRTGSQAVEEFVTAYLQAEELGAPLVDTLNHIALDMRRASAQRLRQLAARVEPRVTLVVTVVMVPGTLIILLVGMFLGIGGGDLGKVFGS